jgi:DNA-binding NtrC family response regulator
VPPKSAHPLPERKWAFWQDPITNQWQLVEPPGEFQSQVNKFSQGLIYRALAFSQGSISGAAEALQLPRTTLIEKMKSLRIPLQ